MTVAPAEAACSSTGPSAVPSMEAMTRISAPWLIMFWTWVICWSTSLSAYCSEVSYPASWRTDSRWEPSLFQRSRDRVGMAMPTSPPPSASAGWSVPSAVSVLSPPPPSGVRSAVQAALVRASARPALSSATFRVVLDIWVPFSGGVDVVSTRSVRCVVAEAGAGVMAGGDPRAAAVCCLTKHTTRRRRPASDRGHEAHATPAAGPLPHVEAVAGEDVPPDAVTQVGDERLAVLGVPAGGDECGELDGLHTRQRDGLDVPAHRGGVGRVGEGDVGPAGGDGERGLLARARRHVGELVGGDVPLLVGDVLRGCQAGGSLQRRGVEPTVGELTAPGAAHGEVAAEQLGQKVAGEALVGQQPLAGGGVRMVG